MADIHILNNLYLLLFGIKNRPILFREKKIIKKFFRKSIDMVH